MSDFALIASTVAQAVTAADVPASAGIGPVGAGIAFGFAALGAGIGIGILVAGALNAVARQPEVAGQVKGMMFLGIAFIEALALIAIILGFVLQILSK